MTDGIISKNGPIFLNNTSIAQINIDLSPYAIQVGNAYRILPVRNPRKDREYLVDTEKSFEIMTKKFRYRGLDNPKVYYNEDYKGFVLNHRSSINSVAQSLIDKGEKEKAKELVMFSLAKMPDVAVPYDYTTTETVNLLFKVGEKAKALEVARVGKAETRQERYELFAGVMPKVDRKVRHRTLEFTNDITMGGKRSVEAYSMGVILLSGDRPQATGAKRESACVRGRNRNSPLSFAHAITSASFSAKCRCMRLIATKFAASYSSIRGATACAAVLTELSASRISLG